MRRSRRIAVSTAVTTGVLGIAGIAVAAVPDAISSKPAPHRNAQADQVSPESLALQQALAQINGRTRSLGADLTAAQRQLEAAARAAATQAAAQAAASTAQPPSTARPAAPRKVIYVQAPALKTTKPATHTTTGASGSAGGDDGNSGGGGDD
jgi:hypothetical protein